LELCIRGVLVIKGSSKHGGTGSFKGCSAPTGYELIGELSELDGFLDRHGETDRLEQGDSE